MSRRKAWQSLGVSPQTRRIGGSRESNLNRAGACAHVNEWRALCKKYGCKCLSCQKPMSIDELTRDHIIPVSKHWSSSRIENLQPLCRWCNERKADQTIDFRPDHSSIVPALLTGHLKGVWKQLDKNGITTLPTHKTQVKKANKEESANAGLSRQLQLQKDAHKNKLAELHEVHQALYQRCRDAEVGLSELHYQHYKLPSFLKALLRLYGWRMSKPTGEVKKRLQWRITGKD